MPKIEFIEFEPDEIKEFPFPTPAISEIPHWYKNLDAKATDNKSKIRYDKKDGFYRTNETLKKCVPFLDALTHGYLIKTPIDVEISKVPEGLSYKWPTPNMENFIETQDYTSFRGFHIPNEFEPTVLKWTNYFTVKTPKNYSILFTHPQNRFDLPFHTFSGLVDTDTYLRPVHFPFMLKKMLKDDLVIPAGTPIAQIILIKNESWTSVNKKEDDLKSKQIVWQFDRYINSYKKKYWKRKSFR